MPTAPTAPTRERILLAAGRQFRANGYAAAGIKGILVESEAPYGSLYHHFPGGKSELGVEAIREGGALYRDLVVAYFDNEVPLAECMRAFFAGAADLLVATDFSDACPIALIALETANSNESMRAAAAAAFESWIEVLAARFRREGYGSERARALAVRAFCAIEGAFLLARTTRTTDALRHAGDGIVEAMSVTDVR